MFYGNYIFAENGIFITGNKSLTGERVSFKLDERVSIFNGHHEAPNFDGDMKDIEAFYKADYLKSWMKKILSNVKSSIDISFDIDINVNRQDLLSCCGAASYSGIPQMHSKKITIFEDGSIVNAFANRLSMYSSMSNLSREFIESIQGEMYYLSTYHRNKFLEKVVVMAREHKRNVIILSDSSNEIKYQGMGQFRTVVSGQNFKTSNSLHIYTLTINDAEILINSQKHLTSNSIKDKISIIKTKLKCKLDEEIKLVKSLLEVTQKSSLETVAAV